MHKTIAELEADKAASALFNSEPVSPKGRVAGVSRSCDYEFKYHVPLIAISVGFS